jgi:DHA3 family macrolide efflux protein-like MFS transporter
MKNWKKNSAFFIGGQSISLFGSMLVQYAIMWHITLETRSGFIMTLSILAGFIPSLFLSPFAGVWVDRFNRKLIIVLADTFIAITTLITALLFYFGYGSITLLLIVSAFRFLGNAVHTPAVQAFIPELVPEDKLMRVQGINNGIQSSMMIIAPVLSAALLASFELFVIFFIDTITAVLGIFTLILFVQSTRVITPIEGKVEYFNDIKLGLNYIKSHHFLVPFFVFTAMVLFFVAPMAFLTPLQTVFNYGPEEWRLSFVEVAFASGMMIGGFSIAAWEGLKNRIHTMALSLILMGLSSIVLSLTNLFWIYLVSMFIIGLSLPYYNSPAYVMIQEKVDNEYLGRVFSVMGMISSSMMPIGMLVFGPLADVIDIDTIIIFSGIMMIIITFSLLFNKSLIQSGQIKQG